MPSGDGKYSDHRAWDKMPLCRECPIYSPEFKSRLRICGILTVSTAATMKWMRVSRWHCHCEINLHIPTRRTGTGGCGLDAAARVLFSALSRWVGLEGKIVVAVVALLAAALGSTCWLWASRIDPQVTKILGEQARQTAVTLSMAARPGFASGDIGALQSMGNELLKARNILFVAFYDVSGKNIATADRESSPHGPPPSLLTTQVSSLAQVRVGSSQALGDYLEVCQPVLADRTMAPKSSRLMGYVSVGISPTAEQRQVQWVNYFATGIGCVVILCFLPLAYLLVHRIFLPIRQLVAATNRISAGDLDAAVAIDRTDAIGDLARSFNAMIETIKRQQQDLRQANTRPGTKVTQRTAQLEAANRRLSSEIAEKEDFLRAVSHDLNAPLRNISGMTSMLLTKHGGPIQRGDRASAAENSEERGSGNGFDLGASGAFADQDPPGKDGNGGDGGGGA